MEQTPITPENLRARLSEGTVSFSFKKLGGNLRMAVGTTDLNKVPPQHHPKGVRESSPRVVTFYDLSKNAWRCVSITSQIWVSH